MRFADLLNKTDIKESVEEQMVRWFERHGVMVFDLLEENFEEKNGSKRKFNTKY